MRSLADLIQFLARQLIAQMIDAVVETLHFPGFRMPGEAEHVPEAMRKNGTLVGLNVEPQVRCLLIRALEAGVTGTPDVDMECTIS